MPPEDQGGEFHEMKDETEKYIVVLVIICAVKIVNRNSKTIVKFKSLTCML